MAAFHSFHSFQFIELPIQVRLSLHHQLVFTYIPPLHQHHSRIHSETVFLFQVGLSIFCSASWQSPFSSCSACGSSSRIHWHVCAHGSASAGNCWLRPRRMRRQIWL